VFDVRTGKTDHSKLEKLTDVERGQDYDMSDTGNAQLLAQLHSDNMRFNHTSKEWLVWNGQYWGKDRKLQRYNFAEDVSRYRQKQAMSIKDNIEKKQMFNFGVHSGDKVKMDSMLAVASTLPEFATTSDDWDQDEFLFQCNNGILVLTDGSFIKSKPDYMISQSSGIDYDPNAQCPVFDQFLIDIMDGDEELAEYLLISQPAQRVPQTH
jgi:putative DNA primase/helicase